MEIKIVQSMFYLLIFFVNLSSTKNAILILKNLFVWRRLGNVYNAIQH